MKPKLVSINEEIVRWSFEIAVKESMNWYIAFTNPTAGPWKRITATNQAGKIGEVHRFEIDETRPDLILVNDTSKEVLIIEAKTSFADLQKKAQLDKTSKLFVELTTKLRKESKNEYWGARATYQYKLGLLWATGEESESQIKETCLLYTKEVSKIIKDIICIEGTMKQNHLKSKLYYGLSGNSVSL